MRTAMLVSRKAVSPGLKCCSSTDLPLHGVISERISCIHSMESKLWIAPTTMGADVPYNLNGWEEWKTHQNPASKTPRYLEISTKERIQNVSFVRINRLDGLWKVRTKALQVVPAGSRPCNNHHMYEIL